MSTPAAPPPEPLISPTKRTAYYSPAAGRHYFSKRAAYNNEAKARFYRRCDCEPPSTCDLHWPEGKYATRRESDGTTLSGRIIRRWARLLAARDRGLVPHVDPRPLSPVPDEDIPFGEEEIDLRGCQTWSPS